MREMLQRTLGRPANPVHQRGDDSDRAEQALRRQRGGRLAAEHPAKGGNRANPDDKPKAQLGWRVIAQGNPRCGDGGDQQGSGDADHRPRRQGQVAGDLMAQRAIDNRAQSGMPACVWQDSNRLPTDGVQQLEQTHHYKAGRK